MGQHTLIGTGYAYPFPDVARDHVEAVIRAYHLRGGWADGEEQVVVFGSRRALVALVEGEFLPGDLVMAAEHVDANRIAVGVVHAGAEYAPRHEREELSALARLAEVGYAQGIGQRGRTRER